MATGLTGLNTQSGEKRERERYHDYIESYQNVNPKSVIFNKNNDFIVNSVPAPEGYGESRYDQNISSIADLQNLGEYRADAQSGASKIFSGAIKGVITAGTTFANGFLGLPVGIVESLGYWSLDKIVNNEVTTATQQINEWAEKVLPNYYTQEERDHPWEHLFSANFIGDKFLKNLGFTYGALAAGNVGGLFKNTINLVGGGINKGWTMSKWIASLCKDAQTANVVRGVYGIGSASLNEASIEAYQASEQYVKDKAPALATMRDQQLSLLDEQFKQGLIDEQTYNVKRNNIVVGFSDAMNKLYEDKAKVANSTLLANTALLAITEGFQFYRPMANGFATARRVAFANRRIGADGVTEYVLPSKGIGNAILKGFGDAGFEGGQEITQNYIGTASRDYYNQDVDNFFRSKYDENYTQKSVDLIKSLAQSFNKTWNDQNAWEEFFIGALTGSMGIVQVGKNAQNADFKLGENFGITSGFIGELGNAKKERLRQQAIIDKANEALRSDPTKISMHFLNHYQAMQDTMNLAAVAGDKKTYKDAEFDQLISYIIASDAIGHLSDYKAHLKDFWADSKLTDEFINKLREDTTNKENDQGPLTGKYTDNNEARKAIKENVKSIFSAIDQYNYIKERLDIKTKNVLSNNQLAHLTWLRSKLENWDNRVKELAPKLLDSLDKVKDFIPVNLDSTLDQIATITQAAERAAQNPGTSIEENYEAVVSERKKGREAVVKGIENFSQFVETLRKNQESIAFLLDSPTEKVKKQSEEKQNIAFKLIELLNNTLDLMQKNKIASSPELIDTIQDAIDQTSDLAKMHSDIMTFNGTLSMYLANPDLILEAEEKQQTQAAQQQQNNEDQQFKARVDQIPYRNRLAFYETLPQEEKDRYNRIYPNDEIENKLTLIKVFNDYIDNNQFQNATIVTPVDKENIKKLFRNAVESVSYQGLDTSLDANINQQIANGVVTTTSVVQGQFYSYVIRNVYNQIKSRLQEVPDRGFILDGTFTFPPTTGPQPQQQSPRIPLAPALPPEVFTNNTNLSDPNDPNNPNSSNNLLDQSTSNSQQKTIRSGISELSINEAKKRNYVDFWEHDMRSKGKTEEHIAKIKASGWKPLPPKGSQEYANITNVNHEDYRGFYDLWMYLDEKGAFEYVNKGNLHYGDTVEFRILPEISNDIVFITTKADSQGNFQVLNIVPNNEQDLIKAVLDEKAAQSSSNINAFATLDELNSKFDMSKRTASYYTTIDGKRYVRWHQLTTAFNERGVEKVLNSEAAIKGTRIDILLRELFNNNTQENAIIAANKSLTEYGDENKDKAQLTENIAKNVWNNALAWKQAKENEGWIFKSINTVVATQLEGLNVAGECDLIMQRGNELKVVDFKTKDIPLNTLNNEEQDPAYNWQLTFYTKALNDLFRNTNIKVTETSLLYFDRASGDMREISHDKNTHSYEQILNNQYKFFNDLFSLRESIEKQKELERQKNETTVTENPISITPQTKSINPNEPFVYSKKSKVTKINNGTIKFLDHDETMRKDNFKDYYFGIINGSGEVYVPNVRLGSIAIKPHAPGKHYPIGLPVILIRNSQGTYSVLGVHTNKKAICNENVSMPIDIDQMSTEGVIKLFFKNSDSNPQVITIIKALTALCKATTKQGFEAARKDLYLNGLYFPNGIVDLNPGEKDPTGQQNHREIYPGNNNVTDIVTAIKFTKHRPSNDHEYYNTSDNKEIFKFIHDFLENGFVQVQFNRSQINNTHKKDINGQLTEVSYNDELLESGVLTTNFNDPTFYQSWFEIETFDKNTNTFQETNNPTQLIDPNDANRESLTGAALKTLCDGIVNALTNGNNSLTDFIEQNLSANITPDLIENLIKKVLPFVTERQKNGDSYGVLYNDTVNGVTEQKRYASPALSTIFKYCDEHDIQYNRAIPLNPISTPAPTSGPVQPESAPAPIQPVLGSEPAPVIAPAPISNPEPESAPTQPTGQITVDKESGVVNIPGFGTLGGGVYIGEDKNELFDNALLDDDLPPMDDSDDPFKLATEKGIQIDMDKEVAWLHSVLPQIPVEICETLIKTAKKGSLAYGQFKNNMIILSRQAVTGTGYHEAFHAVFRLMLTQDERTGLFEEAKKLYDKKAVKKYGTLKHSIQLEEFLADKFMDYQTFNEKPKTLGKKILHFFKRLANMLFHLHTYEPRMLEIFRRINDSYYATYEIDYQDLNHNGTVRTIKQIKNRLGLKATDYANLTEDNKAYVDKYFTEQVWNILADDIKENILHCK